MLVGITGRVCAGKSLVARYLEEHHGFVRWRAPTALASACDGGEPLDAACSLLPPDCWRPGHDYVVCPIDTPAQVEALRKRPCFLLVSVDAPITARFERHRGRVAARRQQGSGDDDGGGEDGDASNNGGRGRWPLSLEQFLRLDDEAYFGTLADDDMDKLHIDERQPAAGVRSPPMPPRPPPPMPHRRGGRTQPSHLRKCMDAADVHIINNAPSVALFYKRLAALDLTNTDRLRPSWDTYFMRMANLASMRTNCMKRRVGAVIVREHRVVATGYNGTPRGTRNCTSGGCARCNGYARAGHALDECLCLHAEENAIIEAGRERCSGATLYTNLCPCLACSKKIAQAGIVQVVYGVDYAMDAMSAALFEEAGVVIRRHGAGATVVKQAGDDGDGDDAHDDEAASGGGGDDAAVAARYAQPPPPHHQDDELRSPSSKFAL